MNKNKVIIEGWDAKEKLKEGVNILAAAVKSTLGPSGKNVILEQEYGSPKITKDGVSVAREIFLKDPLHNIGAQMVKDVASKTNDDAGDGTTTATVLAESIINNGFTYVQTGVNPIELKNGIDKALIQVVKSLKDMSTPVKDKSQIAQVGTVSANNDSTIGNLISDAMEIVGKNGIITVEEGNGTDTYLDTVEGVQFEKGYLSPHFITNQDKMRVELEDPYILILNEKVTNLQDLLPVLESVSQDQSELLIIADEVEGEALATLVINKLRGLLKVAAVKSPSFGDKRKEILEDIATVTGATVISKDKGITLDSFSMDYLGVASKISIDKETTTIVDGKGDVEAIQNRVSQIQSQIDNTDNDWDKEKLKERLAKLSGGVAVLYIGAGSEVEMKERKDRVDDALHATKAAVEEGIVPGGGVALLRSIKAIDTSITDNPNEILGMELLKKAIEAPIRTIIENTGKEPSVIIHRILENDLPYGGYNARTELYEDLMASGIVDPTKVTRTALENAVSIAGSMLTTNVVVSNSREKEDEKEIPPQQKRGMF